MCFILVSRVPSLFNCVVQRYPSISSHPILFSLSSYDLAHDPQCLDTFLVLVLYASHPILMQL